MQILSRTGHDFGKRPSAAVMGRETHGRADSPIAPANRPRNLPVQISEDTTRLHFDVGERLVALVPRMRAVAGARIELETDLALPHSHVRMAGADFDTLILTMVAAAVVAGASAIKLRSHLVGAHIWTLVADDGHMDDRQLLRREAPGRGALCAQLSVAPKSHARLITHVGGRHWAATALILPTVLRVVDAKHTRRSALLETQGHVR